MVRAITSTALGFSLTLSAVFLLTAGMIAGEVRADRRLRAWTSSVGLVLAIAATAVMVIHFAILTRA